MVDEKKGYLKSFMISPTEFKAGHIIKLFITFPASQVTVPNDLDSKRKGRKNLKINRIENIKYEF